MMQINMSVGDSISLYMLRASGGQCTCNDRTDGAEEGTLEKQLIAFFRFIWGVAKAARCECRSAGSVYDES